MVPLRLPLPALGFVGVEEPPDPLLLGVPPGLDLPGWSTSAEKVTFQR
jgi:hypothetical protein